MEVGSFISTEENDDLIVSFVIEDAEPGEIKSLILMRTPKYEFVLEDRERGVNVSHEDQPEVEDDLLSRISLTPDVVIIESKYNRYELNISRVDKKQLEKACALLRRMNFDERFILEIV